MDQRNVIIAVALSIALLIGWQFWWGKTHPTPPPQQTVSAPATPAANKDAQANNATQPANANGALPATLKDALAEPRIKIETPSLNGSITLKGARLDDLTLSKYREEIDPKSPPITLLTPAVG